MRKRDFIWVLAYPLYQLIGSFRHEASHALVAIINGHKITDFSFWPSSGYWGYVSWDGDPTVASIAAPYLCDLLTFLLFYLICMSVVFQRRWLWINMVTIGIISPFVNSSYNYLGGLHSMNDIGWLLRHIQSTVVHAYFLCTLAIYILGTILVFTVSKTRRKAASNKADWKGSQG